MRTKRLNLGPEAVRHVSQSVMTAPCHRVTGQCLVLALVWGRAVAQDEVLVKVKVKAKVKVSLTPIDEANRRVVGVESRPFEAAGPALSLIH